MPEKAQLNRVEFYDVKPNTPITLSAVIGDNQPGGTAVLFNGVPAGSGNPIVEKTIGAPGQNLKGGEIECMTTVRDNNPATNRTSVTYTLRGGVTDRVFPYAIEVEEGGRALYLISFVLR